MPKSHPRKSKFTIYLFSDSSGNLLEHFFNAMLTQFPAGSFNIQTIPFLKTEKMVEEAVTEIKSGIVFHGVVTEKMKKKIETACADKKIPCWDVTGPTSHFLQKITGIQPAEEALPIHTVDSGYMRRMGALEFAMQHDDSRRLEEINKADIILVGISRVSKSPNALFLAYRGFRVANISFVPSHGLPESLEKHTAKNVVALTMQPKRLARIRHRRFSEWKINEFDYEDISSVVHEVMDAEKIYKRKGWPVIDTTDLAVEETSALILSALHLKPKIFEISVTPETRYSDRAEN